MLNLNYILVQKYYQQPSNLPSSIFKHLEKYDYMTLYYAKWWMQIVFSICFALLTYFILVKWFKTNYSFLQIAGVYGISALLIISIYALGSISLFAGQTAHIARILLELQHSPIIFMVLIMISIFNQKIST